MSQKSQVSKIVKVVRNCQKLSKLSEIVKVVRNLQSFQKFVKIVRYCQSYQNCQSCQKLSKLSGVVKVGRKWLKLSEIVNTFLVRGVLKNWERNGQQIIFPKRCTSARKLVPERSLGKENFIANGGVGDQPDFISFIQKYVCTQKYGQIF